MRNSCETLSKYLEDSTEVQTKELVSSVVNVPVLNYVLLVVSKDYIHGTQGIPFKISAMGDCKVGQ